MASYVRGSLGRKPVARVLQRTSGDRPDARGVPDVRARAGREVLRQCLVEEGTEE
jgi:hypothetical protein